jgi:transcriptional regulator MraZ
VFRGITAINLDTKGRLAIPVRYREPVIQAANKSNFQFVITIDTETSCLLLYPTTEWEVIEQKLQALSSFNQASRRIQRLLLGHATELEMDSAGRVLIPQLLRDYAKLTKHVILVGQGKKFELWDETSWNEHREMWLSEEAHAKGDLPDEIKNLVL